MNNNDDNERFRQAKKFLKTFMFIEFTWLFLYFLTNIPYTNEAAEEAAAEETVNNNIAEDIARTGIADIPDAAVDTTPDPVQTPAMERIKLDNNVSVVYIDGVAYMVYENGYGSGYSVAVTPMYNPDGSIKTKETEE